VSKAETMTTTAQPTIEETPPEHRPRQDSGTASWWRLLVLRLHFYVGVFVGPFLLVAATSGALYALSPQLEPLLYDRELQVVATDDPLPLAAQIEAARAVEPGSELLGVRPAPEPGDTTRVLFDNGDLGESEAHAVFVDPGTGDVRGELTTYGTSGALPVRMWIDQLHRSLLLGDTGRLYSELAASWLWVMALAGVVLWVSSLRRRRRARDASRAEPTLRGRARTRSLHGSLGIWLAVAFLGLSATGLTWSTYAGANVTELRTQLSWMAPELATDGGPAGLHAGHGDAGSGAAVSAGPGSVSDLATYDEVLAAARDAGIDADKVEILTAAEAGQAWTVTEVDRGWPSQVDAASIDPQSLDVVDEVRFADYPFMAKMARWGIDAHMGSLFGLPNQILLAAVGTGLVLMIVWGYRMWWQRRPRHGGTSRFGKPFPRGALRHIPLPMLVPAAIGVVLVAWFLPLLGLSLLAFLAVDALLALRARARTRAARETM
jgi:uncharacterized iron-regulated membrane protein